MNSAFWQLSDNTYLNNLLSNLGIRPAICTTYQIILSTIHLNWLGNRGRRTLDWMPPEKMSDFLMCPRHVNEICKCMIDWMSWTKIFKRIVIRISILFIFPMHMGQICKPNERLRQRPRMEFEREPRHHWDNVRGHLEQLRGAYQQGDRGHNLPTIGVQPLS